MLRTVSIAAAVLAMVGCPEEPENEGPAFESTVESEPAPWTHQRFGSHDEASLRFAVLGDRTSGARPAVFERIVRRTDAMGPDFILSVGDLIEGSHPEAGSPAAQWRDLRGTLDDLRSPFFFVPGNHDLLSPETERVYRAEIGPLHYAFVRRQVLVLCLNSQPPSRGYEPYLDEAQIAFAQRTLERHRDVRWTFVVMHHPLWVDHFRYREDESFAKLAALLRDRSHTVFAGHLHRYTHYLREGADHVVLGPSGGSHGGRGARFGELDQVLWVHVAAQGAPRLTVLSNEGMLPVDFRGEAAERLRHGLEEVRFDLPSSGEPERRTWEPTFHNLFDHPVRVSLRWEVPEATEVEVTPARGGWEIEAGAKVRERFVMTGPGVAGLAEDDGPSPPVMSYELRRDDRRTLWESERNVPWIAPRAE
ncbi:MAG: metallophosphoesterase family protein [Myxococcota bacterium]